jgi:molecular chaperone HtpG
MTIEIKKFSADVGKVLELMIHSLYTNKEIFLRELISNSSDACDKLRYLSQTNNALLGDDPEFKIKVKIYKEDRKIVIYDNGIGMNKQDLIDNLGTIASSGTQKFLDSLKQSGGAAGSELIGQFGVGFYSSYMVADKVSVLTKKAGEKEAYQWVSDGLGEYSISDSNSSFERGTEITVHLKEKEDQFLDHFRVKTIIKNYSDHISVPIYFLTEKDEETKLNSSSALWSRSKSEITEEQYNEFYKSVSHSVDKPWLTLHNKNEGKIEFTNLLFIPSEKTFDLFHPDRIARVKLYIKRVFITEQNIDLIPRHLRFLRGVIDSEDLPLNISRETLQHNATIEKIRKSVTKRVVDELKKKLDNDRDEYELFWNNFGAALKEGLCEGGADNLSLMEICLFNNTGSDKKITLDEYIQNMQEGQKIIYYLSGEDPEKLKNSPQIEGLIKQGINVLLFTDHVDDFWVSVNSQYKDYDIKSATRSDIEVEKNQDNKEEKDISDQVHADLIKYFKDCLGTIIKDVKISKKLTSSPVCLVVDDSAMDIRMERFLVEQKQLNKVSAKILEINPSHNIIKKIELDLQDEKQKTENSDLVKLLFDQACILEGEMIKDSPSFNSRLTKIIEKAIS